MTDADAAEGRRAERLVLRTVLLDLVAFGIVLPLLPAAGARFAARPWLIGVLVATDSALSFVLAPWWGRLSDRIGRRPVILVGLAGSVAGYLLFGLAGSFAALLLSRVITGSVGATVNVAQASLADLTTPERRAHAMGLVGAAFGVGFTVGPALGGIALRWGDAAPGLLAAGIAALNAALTVASLPESRVRAPRPVPAPRAALPAHVVAAMLGTTLGFTVMYAVFPLFCREVLGLPRSGASWYFVLLGLVTLVVQGRVVGRLARRTGERVLVGWGGALMAAGLGAMPLAAPLAGPARLALLGLAVALLSTGFGLAGPGLAGYVSRTAGREVQGGALGALQGVGALARIAGPPLLGGLVEWAGVTAAFGAAAGAAGLGAAALLARRPAAAVSAGA